ncbi:hypothetical protein [Nocardia sp. NPDC051570]|uniref:hypothetical protein n=1 Tax=Nocardia sp. NPDC051570 TaxID=3364324 RepID=UPI0037A13FDC
MTQQHPQSKLSKKFRELRFPREISIGWLHLYDHATGEMNIVEATGIVAVEHDVELVGARFTHLRPEHAWCLPPEVLAHAEFLGADDGLLATLAPLPVRDLAVDGIVSAARRGRVIEEDSRAVVPGGQVLTDAGLEYFIGHRSLARLAVHDTSFTDQCLAEVLVSCPLLDAVSIGSDRLTGELLHHLDARPMIELGIDSPQLTGDALSQLPEFPRVEHAAFCGSRVFDDLDPVRLRKSFPNLVALTLTTARGIRPYLDSVMPILREFTDVPVNGVTRSGKGRLRFGIRGESSRIR